jgi:hypothetical protein
MIHIRATTSFYVGSVLGLGCGLSAALLFGYWLSMP